MKYFKLLICSLLVHFAVKAQTFTINTSQNIPDNTLLYFPIVVNGLPNTIDSISFGVKSVCISLTHPYVGQLDIYLKSPNGTRITLSNNRGSNGKNFENTCFSEAGTLAIENGAAPFLGTFIPDESINLLNNLQNPNGTWLIGVLDEIPFITGKFLSGSITFGNNPPATPINSGCSLTNGFGCKCADGTNNCDLLPDMTNSAKVIANFYYDEPGIVHIGVGTPNIGYGPLDVRGTGECYCDSVKVTDPLIPCPNGNYPKEKVVQRIYKKVGPTITYYDRAAGYMEYHPTHGHIHIENWTNNTLRIKGPDENPLTWPIVGRDSKVSFCLVNNFNCSANLGYCVDNLGNPISHTNTGNPGLGVASGCGREQGIFPGYLDIYYPGYDGQEIKFDSSLCNGEYYIVSTTDPANVMLEMNENNNTSVVPIKITAQQNGNCCTAGFKADTLTGIAPFEVNFIDTTKPSSAKWFWEFGDGKTDTTQFPTHVYTHAGNFTVSLTTIAKETGCTNTATKNKYIKVRNNTTTVTSNQFQVYPNPFTKVVNIFYATTLASTNTISILDIAGRTVYTKDLGKEEPGLHEVTLTPVIPSGVYLIKLTIGNVTQYSKVIKQ